MRTMIFWWHREQTMGLILLTTLIPSRRCLLRSRDFSKYKIFFFCNIYIVIFCLSFSFILDSCALLKGLFASTLIVHVFIVLLKLILFSTRYGWFWQTFVAWFKIFALFNVFDVEKKNPIVNMKLKFSQHKFKKLMVSQQFKKVLVHKLCTYSPFVSINSCKMNWSSANFAAICLKKKTT